MINAVFLVRGEVETRWTVTGEVSISVDTVSSLTHTSPTLVHISTLPRPCHLIS